MACGPTCSCKSCKRGHVATKKHHGAVRKVKSVYKKCVRKLRGTVRLSEVHKVCGRLSKRRVKRKTAKRRAKRSPAQRRAISKMRRAAHKGGGTHELTLYRRDKKPGAKWFYLGSFSPTEGKRELALYRANYPGEVFRADKVRFNARTGRWVKTR